MHTSAKFSSYNMEYKPKVGVKLHYGPPAKILGESSPPPLSMLLLFRHVTHTDNAVELWQITDDIEHLTSLTALERNLPSLSQKTKPCTDLSLSNQLSYTTNLWQF